MLVLLEALESKLDVKLTCKPTEKQESKKHYYRCFGYKMQEGNYSTLHCWVSMSGTLHFKKDFGRVQN